MQPVGNGPEADKKVDWWDSKRGSSKESTMEPLSLNLQMRAAVSSFRPSKQKFFSQSNKALKRGLS